MGAENPGGNGGAGSGGGGTGIDSDCERLKKSFCKSFGSGGSTDGRFFDGFSVGSSISLWCIDAVLSSF